MAVDHAQAGRSSQAVSVDASGFPPVFIVHGMHGFIRFEPVYQPAVRPGQPLHLFELPGLRGGGKPSRRVPEIAAAYASDLRSKWPEGPVLLAAFCMGSLIAIELARQLERAGRRPQRLVLIDPLVTVSATRLYRSGAWHDSEAIARFESEEVRERSAAYMGRVLVEHARRGQDPLLKRYPGNMFSIPARAMLFAAYHTYRPERLDWPVDVVVSRERLSTLTSPSVWDECLPQRKLHIGGESHDDVIASRGGRTAELLRRILG